MMALEVPAADRTRPTSDPPLKRVSVLVYTETVFGREVHAGIQNYRHETERTESWLLLERLLHEEEPARRIEQERPDGVIAQAFDAELAKQIDATDVPWVNIGDRLPDVRAPLITTNDELVGRMAAEHLVQRGVRHFGFVSNGWVYAGLRYEAFSEYLRERDYTAEHIESEPIASWWQGPPEEVQRELDRVSDWLKALPKPAGLFCANDYYAKAINSLCTQQGIDVPQQLLILGCDNDELMCGSMRPPLSSIQLNAERIGYEAAAALGRLMAGDGSVPYVTTVEPIGLVPRMSTELVAVEDELVRNALLFIEAHACAGINVDDVAKNAGISRRLLELRFSKALRQSPAYEIRRRRIERAMELLRDTDWKIAQIAEEAGFNNPGQFATTFRKWTGSAPMAYRKQFSRP